MDILIPSWFKGSEIFIDFFSFIVLSIFFILSLKYYKLCKKKNFLYLGIGFLLIAVAQLASIFTKFVLYYDTSFTQNIGQMVITYRVVKSVDIFYYAGFFFQKLLTLLGFYLIYRLPLKKKFSGDFMLALYFIILSALVSITSTYFFHITVLILLIFITINYYNVYRENKNINTKILIFGFIILIIGEILFSVTNPQSIAFIFANIIELIGYSVLLVLIIRILYCKHCDTIKNSAKAMKGRNGQKKR